MKNPSGSSDEHTTRFIVDRAEYDVICQYFLSQNIFEVQRIMNWTLSYMRSNQDLVKTASKMIWLDPVNARLRQLNRKELTPEEIALRAIRNNPCPSDKDQIKHRG